jgi:uncharacterized protein
MPANPFNSFTDYGVGIGLRVPHYRHILAKKPVVDWFEIISENFMVDGARPLEVLDSILEQLSCRPAWGSDLFWLSREAESRAPQATEAAC